MAKAQPGRKGAAAKHPGQRVPVRDRKDSRLNLRISQEQRRELERAARVEAKTLSTFVLEKVHLAAQEVLAEQVEFVLPDPEWTAFCSALEEHARPNPALRALLTRPTPPGAT